ncbi:MAG: amidohydrolase [Saccharofermentanales bacterium]|jgi:amidohydrolase
MLKNKLFEMLDFKKADMLRDRRWLHRHPELSYEEEKTSNYILQHYAGKDVKVESNIGGYGIKVTIDSGKPGKTLALRADFDALPLEEQTGLPFASENPGVMHACGHDAHTAYMMAMTDCLIELKDELVGKIVIIHQPAEEMPPGGALMMIRDGVLEGVDNVVGCHVMSQMDCGNVYYHVGPTQQSRAKFTIRVQGKGGHGSSPHEANDSIVIASQLVVNLQTIISRRLNPFEPGVITIGSFDGKGQFNIIKDSVELIGDVRCMSDQTKQLFESEIRNICRGFEIAYSCKIDLDYKNDYPVLVNDEKMTMFVVDAIESANIEGMNDVLDCGPLPSSEDFAYYTEIVPSCFFFIGAKPQGESYPHHHPKFDIDEKSMLYAAKAMAAVVDKYMEEQKQIITF